MSNYKQIVRAVRLAMETAEPTGVESSEGDFTEMFTFTVDGRHALQQAVRSAGDLVRAGEACDNELTRQITEFRSLQGARATYALKAQLHTICRLPRLWEMDSDGILGPLEA